MELYSLRHSKGVEFSRFWEECLGGMEWNKHSLVVILFFLIISKQRNEGNSFKKFLLIHSFPSFKVHSKENLDKK